MLKSSSITQFSDYDGLTFLLQLISDHFLFMILSSVLIW